MGETRGYTAGVETWLDTATLNRLADYCRHNRIRSLSLFGSHLHGEAHAESDLDLLIEFHTCACIGLFRLAQMELDLTDMLRRKVDLRTAQELSRHFRQQVLGEAKVIYAEK